MTEKIKRRWFQFSLRALLVFTLLVSIAMSWLGVKLRRARRQREAVDVIEKLGGYVQYAPMPNYTESSPPEWMVNVLGEDCFRYVSSANLSGTGFGDEEMPFLKRLTNLNDLDLGLTQITDARLDQLESLIRLTGLNLSSTQISDAGLRHLEGLPRLADLGLSGTRVTDDGLEHLEGMTSLTTLDLRDTQVSDAGLEHLKALPGLALSVSRRHASRQRRA